MAKKDTTHAGSTVLFFIFMLGFVAILIRSVLRTTVFSLDISACRQQSMQQFYAAEGLVLAGITWCLQHVDSLRAPHVIYDGPWMQWRGHIALEEKNTKYVVRGILYQDTRYVAEQRCVIACEDHTVCVKEWEVCTESIEQA